MGRKDALASLIGRGEGTNRLASEVARDIDWMKVRRAQYGISRPRELDLASPGEELKRARSRRLMGLAHALAFAAGVLLGLALLRGLSDGPRLLAASAIMAGAGLVAAASCRVR